MMGLHYVVCASKRSPSHGSIVHQDLGRSIVQGPIPWLWRHAEIQSRADVHSGRPARLKKFRILSVATIDSFNGLLESATMRSSLSQLRLYDPPDQMPRAFNEGKLV